MCKQNYNNNNSNDNPENLSYYVERWMNFHLWAGKASSSGFKVVKEEKQP